MKKILFIAEELQTNGASKSLLALLRTLVKEYKVELFLFSRGGELMGEVSEGVKVLPENSYYRIFRAPLKTAILNAIKSLRVDLAAFRVLVAADRALRLRFSMARFLPRIEGEWDVAIASSDGFVSEVVEMNVKATRKLAWVHINYEDDFAKLVTTGSSIGAMKKMDTIVGVSKDALKHLENVDAAFKTKKKFVVHNIVDAEEVQMKSRETDVKLSARQFNLVSMGRVSHEKGFDIIPETLSKLVADGFDVHWTIIGPSVPAIEESITADGGKLGVADRITFLGSKENPFPYIVKADCYVQPSRNEGWGMAISEAMVLGCPIVCTDLAVFAEQVIDGENGYLAPFNPTAFAEVIAKVLRGELKLVPVEADKLLFSVENVRKEFASLVEGL